MTDAEERESLMAGITQLIGKASTQELKSFYSWLYHFVQNKLDEKEVAE